MSSDPKRALLGRLIHEITGARLVGVELVQSLWSGYGELVRCRLDGGERSSVIVKHVRWPSEANHPRGWSTELSHRRKARSYQVEATWYQEHAAVCGSACRVPQCLGVRQRGDDVYLVLEDLDEAGFAARLSAVTDRELNACLGWLANFHAAFMGREPSGLWPVGTYWHLATRPDELAALADGPLKRHASEIDRRLSGASYQTFVHGDAKLANFCFSSDGSRVAAVDFQYVGGGCGMKDLAYFVSSCLDEDAAEERETELLDRYFAALELALADSDIEAAAVAADWRPLYPVAWTDFVRFLQGWSPGHWKIHRYSERLAREVLGAL